MAQVVLHALHGTFQSPSVWEELESQLESQLEARFPSGLSSPPDGLRAGSLSVSAEPVEPPRAGGLVTWGSGFCARIRDEERNGAGARRVLLGYSLGGRLALHALLACPERWAAAILVAAHPGGGEQTELARIRARDAAWADRCRREPLASLLSEWDALPVFAGLPNRAPRSVAALDAERCGRAFEAFSRADQADLRPVLSAAARSEELPPVLYVSGRDDVGYRTIGEELERRVPGIRHVTIPGAGHRVPWDRPVRFAETVVNFLVEHLVR